MSKEKQRQLDEINRPRNEELYNNIEKQYKEIAKARTESEQIEEMARVYDVARLKARDTLGSMNEGEGMWYSKAFYDAGYRKQNEGEWRGELRHRCDWRGKKQRYYQPNSCSVCHEAVAERTPFCPHCGAKMKGGAE